MRPRGLRAPWRWGNRSRTYAFQPSEPTRRSERELMMADHLIAEHRHEFGKCCHCVRRGEYPSQDGLVVCSNHRGF
jgi:hypothetical protein